jgi:hypothetical protein
MIVNLCPAKADMFAALMTTPSAIDSREQMLVALKAMLGKRHEPFRAGPEKEKYADAYENEIRTFIKELAEPRAELDPVARRARLSDLIPGGEP